MKREDILKGKLEGSNSFPWFLFQSLTIFFSDNGM